MTMTDAAKIILADKGTPMHARELVIEIEARDLFKFGAKNPASVLSGALNKKSETFERVGSGTYALKS